MPESPDVILLRSADEPDRYLSAFADAGYEAVCKPVLTFAFPNQSALAECLARRERFGALVATSPRVGTALRRLFGEREELAQAWRGALAYAVGPKTAAQLRDTGLQPMGAEAGDAAALAARIVDEAPSSPLLFLCGNRRRDTLPERLRRAGVPFEELVVYETRTRDGLTLPPAHPSVGTTWLVFYSPSGLEAVERAGGVDLADYRIATIGPTTGGALDEVGVEVEAVAREPSPAALVSAIKEEAEEP